MTGDLSLGALRVNATHHRFRVWAPSAKMMDVHFVHPRERIVAMKPAERGYFEADVDSVEPGSLYFYRIDGERDRPDPASRHQPRGVHGPSAVVAPGFAWTDAAWKGLPLADYIIYELHVGTFSEEGTFDGVARHLDEICELGVTAIELMPVAQCPGSRNWGYDGVYPFAVQDSYGGPDGLRRLVDQCHRRGLAVVLDVVYNHLGPEGNYLADFAPYFTDAYRTAWGRAINFDQAGSDDVRRYFIENAIHWSEWYHVDALRLDAVHAIVDVSARWFLQELAERTGGRPLLIAESDANDARMLHTPGRGGCGMHAQWNDDFHHALHALLTGETVGYYQDFGTLEHMEKAMREGFVYTGEYSGYRGRRHGSSSHEFGGDRLVVFGQNHDQVGNRAQSERLSALVSTERLKLAAAAVILSPYIPLLFMGEEYAERAPFYYFISHTDPGLADAVRLGRRREFAAFAWKGVPPDPQAPGTFAASKLTRTRHEGVHRFYTELIRLRRTEPALCPSARESTRVERQGALLFLHRGDRLMVALNFSDRAVRTTLPGGAWDRRLDSASPEFSDAAPRDGGESAAGMLAPFSAVVYVRKD